MNFTCPNCGTTCTAYPRTVYDLETRGMVARQPKMWCCDCAAIPVEMEVQP